MNKIKIIKKNIRKSTIWKRYKKKFKHRQMKFLISKILLIYCPNIDISVLLKKENMMLQSKIIDQEKMFLHIFKDFNKFTGLECDWNSFAKMLFYIYQTSTYWQDVKKGKWNIFNENHYLKNQRKRNLYTQWLKSLDFKKNTTNEEVINILGLVF